MLTRIQIKNFKKLNNVDIELGKTVVLIGPNNSGKTTALQALALWDIGLRRWNEKREGKTSPEKRPGVTINRRDLISIPVPTANLLWSDLHVRSGAKAGKTQNIRIDVIVNGIVKGKEWVCGIEFDYSNEESFVCRPVRQSGFENVPVKDAKLTVLPEEANEIKIAFLPPMSGLAAVEPKWEQGRINVLLGEGQTAQVLRNLCYQIYEKRDTDKNWNKLSEKINELFGITLHSPEYVVKRGEITMEYAEPNGVVLDLSSSGRGLQQTLLLLAYLYSNPKSILLLDEPDAHLEILRQRQIYQLITEIAENQGSQIIAASHSEVVLNEAADRDMVVAFVGTPHRIDDRGSQVLKALKEIGFENYYQAEQTGWVLYLEGSTDLAILKAFAKILEHEAETFLEKPFVHYVGNQPGKVRDHFWGLREAKNDLAGIALFDRLDRPLPSDLGAEGYQWRKREFENYFCLQEVLLAYCEVDQPDDLFGLPEKEKRKTLMSETIQEISQSLKTLGKPDPWSPDIKASDDFLNPLFVNFFNKLNLSNVMDKSDYHLLAKLVPKGKIDPEIKEKLDAIVAVAKKAKPRED